MEPGLSKMLMEIGISTVIAIVLIAIGCIVLGLQIKTIKSNISTNQSATTTQFGTVNQQLGTTNTSISNIQSDTGALKAAAADQETNLYNLDQDLAQYKRTEKSYVDGQMQTVNTNTNNLKFKIGSTQESVDTLASGARPFTALRVGPATFQREANGNFLIDSSTASNVDFTAKQLNMKSNACIQMGSNTICNTIGGWNVTGNWTTSNIITANNYNLSNLNISNKNGNLYVQDLKGISKGITVNGIIQTTEGSMIDYNGYGLGEYSNGTLRTYAPSKAGSTLAMSFGTTGNFRDVVKVQNATGSARDTISIAGDVSVTGALTNTAFQAAQTQLATALTDIKTLKDSVAKLSTVTPTPTSDTVTSLELSVYAITGMGSGDPPAEITLLPTIPAALIPLASLSADDLAKKNAVYTMSMRIKMTNTTPNWRNILYYGVGKENDRSPGVWQVPNGTGIHYRHRSTQDGNFGFDSIPLTALNTWYHLVISCDGSSLRAYINGTPSQVVTLNAGQYFQWGNTIPQKAPRMRSTNDWGASQTSGTQVNDMYMLPIAMTAADVAALYTKLYS